MKTLFLLLIIYNLQYVARSQGSSIIYNTYPKKVHPDPEHHKLVKSASYFKKDPNKKRFTRFQPPPIREWPIIQNNKNAGGPPVGEILPIDFQGDIKSRVKKVPYFNEFDSKDSRRSKRAANESKIELTTKTSSTVQSSQKMETPKVNKPTLATGTKNATISRRFAPKNVKAAAKSGSKRPKPRNVAKLNDAKAKRARSIKRQGAKKRVNSKRGLRKRKSRVARAGKAQAQNVKGKQGSKLAARQAGRQSKKSGKPAARRSQTKANPKARRRASRRLISARDARPEDYPYMISIQKDGVHWCSGAILNPQLVISTANCFWKSKAVSRMKVRAGARSIDTGGQTAYIAEVRKHPNWSIRKDPTNDVALALLDRHLKFSDAVHGVDLPNIFMKPPFDDAWVTSYGSERRDGVFSRMRQTLQVTHMRLMSDEKCNNITTRFGVYLDDSFFCLEQIGRRAPCTRDTGAPAVSDGVLWGLASWGIRKLCGTERFPAMFSDISEMTNIDFIINATKDMMGEQRLNPFLDRLPMRAREININQQPPATTPEPPMY